MYYVALLPADKWEYMQVEQRWANWPDKECYTKENIELLIEGPKYEYNKKTYTTPNKGKPFWFKR